MSERVIMIKKRDSVIKNLWIRTIRYRDDLILNNLKSVGLDIEYIIFERAGEINPRPKKHLPLWRKGGTYP